MDQNNANDWFMDDHLSPELSFLSNFAIPSGPNGEDLSLFDFLDNDTNHSDIFADGPTEDVTVGIDGLDVAQAQLFDIDPSEYIDLMVAALPMNNSVQENPPPKKNPITSFVVKSSEVKNTINLINGGEFIRTGQSLQLIVPPLLYQRARYENELNRTLRYIFVPNNGSLTLQMPDLRSNITPGTSIYVRITRTTVPYEPDGLVLCHPYPIWLNDKDAKVHNGSLFIPAIGQTIEIEKLVLQRSKQDSLRKIQQFPIFTSQQIDFNSYHSTNTSDPKDIIDQYNLRYSILHFQIFLIDQNNNAYPTDLECQTEPIYEFEGNELQNLPLYVRNIMKQSVTRKQIGQRKESSIKKKMAKKHLNG